MKKQRSTQATTGKKWVYRALAAVCVLLVLIPLSGVFAKYISTLTAEDDVTAALFVAVGDYAAELSGGEAAPRIEVSGWKDDILLTLYNHKDEKVSQTDITYTCTVPTGWTVQGGTVLKEEAGIATVQGGGAIPGGAPGSITIRLTPPATAKQGDEIPFALTTAPYAVTLQATLVLADAREPAWELVDMGAYTLLKIHTNDFEGRITVKYNGDIFAPDTTNALMQDWLREDGEGDLAAERFRTYELRLFEEIPKAYTYTSSAGAMSDAEYIITVTATATEP